VWDLPTRLFHWTLLALVILAWTSAEKREMVLHAMAGAGIAGLLVFRIWWGIFGSSSARFSSFLKGPAPVWTYCRSLISREAQAPEPGHNPMGGWSVAALLLCLIVITAFGLFAVDIDGIDSGPLSSLVDYETGRAASRLHSLAFEALQILVALHILAILFYRVVKRQDLVEPMMSGKSAEVRAGARLKPGSPAMLAVGLVLGLATAAYLARLGGAF
jgi:cytochrome b